MNPPSLPSTLSTTNDIYRSSKKNLALNLASLLRPAANGTRRLVHSDLDYLYRAPSRTSRMDSYLLPSSPSSSGSLAGWASLPHITVGTPPYSPLPQFDLCEAEDTLSSSRSSSPSPNDNSSSFGETDSWLYDPFVLCDPDSGVGLHRPRQVPSEANWLLKPTASSLLCRCLGAGDVSSASSDFYAAPHCCDDIGPGEKCCYCRHTRERQSPDWSDDETTDGNEVDNDDEEQLVYPTARKNIYVFNWLHMEQMKSLSKSRFQAKQQASVLWLMSKAYNNNIPNNLLEPYYRDQEGQDQLKPHIVHALANAELYCLALGNIYADQNHHSLNHNGVMMLLQRKGVYVVQPADVSLTETVLVQVAPLRMTAHMAVIEAVMALYIKEVLIPEKIVQCVKKFCSLSVGTNLPADPEDAIVFWINESCDKMKKRIHQEMEYISSEQGKESTKPPHIPLTQDLSDLSDGCCLSLLLSFYCPDHFSWKDICLNETLSLADSLYNLQLVLKFCKHVLPFNFHFLSLEDVLYMHSSIRQNILAFLADMFFILEVKPAKCVKSPGLKDHKIHIPAQRSKGGLAIVQSSAPAGIQSSKQLPSPIPDLRNTNHTYEFSYSSPKSPVAKDGNRSKSQKFSSSPGSLLLTKNDNSGFESSLFNSNGDHRLSRDEGQSFYSKDSPSEAIPAAGIRSATKRSEEALVPARLKQSKEKSHKDSKVEERGESPEKTKHTGIIGEADIVLTSITGSPRRAVPNNAPMASNLTGIPGFQSPSTEVHEWSFADVSHEKRNSRELSPDKITRQTPASELLDNTNMSSNFVESAKKREANLGSSFELGYTDETSSPQKSNLVKKDGGKVDSPKPTKKTSFAAAPSNTTTWQQQFANMQLESQEEAAISGGDPDAALTSQLNNIRLELEEKRRNIELEKKKVEMMWNKQRQKVGKAAFLQAVSKNPEKLKSDAESSGDASPDRRSNDGVGAKSPENVPAADEEQLGNFHTSIGHLNESLSDLQSDINKLSKQQEQIQNMVTNQGQPKEDDQPRTFYLHNQRQAPPTANPLQGVMKSSTMPNMKANARPAAQQPPPPAGQPHMDLHNQQQTMMAPPHGGGPNGSYSMPPAHMMPQHSMPQFPHQRGQWGNRPVNQDLSVTAGRRSQWNQASPQSMVNTSPQRQPWYMPQPANPPIMSTGQYPVPYNHEYLPPPGQQVPYTLYQNGQMDGHHYPYSGPQYPPSQPSYPPYSSHPMPSTHPYGQPQPNPFRLHDQSQGHLPPNSMAANVVPQHDMNQAVASSAPQQLPHSTAQYGHNIDANAPASPVSKIEVKPQENPQMINEDLVKNLRKKSESEEMPTSPKPENKYALGKTFRVPKPRVKSPTAKQVLSTAEDDEGAPELPTQPIKDGTDNDLGFFVSFDESPVKPKPKFRAKSAGQTRGSAPTKQDASLAKMNNPFRRSPVVADKSSPLHHINNRTVDSASSSSSSVPEVLASPRPNDSSNDSRNEDESESAPSGVGFIIGADLVNPDPVAEDEMQRRKEKIMLISLQRKARSEAQRSFRERENAKQREEERLKKEMLERKKEEEKMRRQMIFEQYKQRKQAEAEEAEGRVPEPSPHVNASRTLTKSRPRSARPRPKSQYVSPGGGSHDYAPSSMSSRGSMRGSQPNLSIFGNNPYDDHDGEPRVPMRRAMSPPPGSSLPGGYYGRPGPPSEASDTCSTTSSVLDYTGPRLFVKPASKSNRGIVLNAVNTVLAGFVNADVKRNVLEEINKSESKHFLILFRDEGLKFRSIYSYNPDREEVFKLYGTGPKQVTEKMMDKFYKYNSGTKSFTEIHTKHLTVTIDAITIQNSLWQAKSTRRVPPRRDYM